jgi:hypothetical protein
MPYGIRVYDIDLVRDRNPRHTRLACVTLSVRIPIREDHTRDLRAPDRGEARKRNGGKQAFQADGFLRSNFTSFVIGS